MRGTRDHSIDGTASIAVCLSVFVLVSGLGAFGGYRLMQPRVIPNLGLAAYQPPPGTRLLPLPRKTDAPELADLPPTPVAVEPERPPESVGKATVAEGPKPVARRPRVRSVDDPASAYAYSGRWGYNDQWGRNDRWSHGDRWSNGDRYGDRGRGSWSSWRGGWNQRW